MPIGDVLIDKVETLSIKTLRIIRSKVLTLDLKKIKCIRTKMALDQKR